MNEPRLTNAGENQRHLAGKSLTVLHLGAGRFMRHSIRRLREEGFRVFAVDGNPMAPAFNEADGHAPVDVTDIRGVINYARQIDADVILPVNELGVLTAAQASRELGLPGLSTEVLEQCINKGRMRDCWHRAGLPQPEYQIVSSVEEIAKAARKLGYPVILKPTKGWGSRGVSLVSNETELPWAINFARGHFHDAQSEYVVESFVPGMEMTVEGLVQAGKPHILTWSDKDMQAHPHYRVTMALNYPARITESQADLVSWTVREAVLALGIENGAFHCECMLNESGVYLIEMGARGGGGHIFGLIVEAVTGICMPATFVKILLGEKVNLDVLAQSGVCYKFFSPPPGVFEAVNGLEKTRQLSGVLDVDFALERGTKIEAIAVGASRPGFVVAVGDNRQEAIANANRAVASVRFIMQPPKAQTVCT